MAPASHGREAPGQEAQGRDAYNQDVRVPSGLLYTSLFEGLGPCHLAASSGDIIYANRAVQKLFADHSAVVPRRLPEHIVRRALRQPDGVRTALVLGDGAQERPFKVLHRRLGEPVDSGGQILTTYEDSSREAQALAAVRRAKSRSDDVAGIVADWVWETDPAWRLTVVTSRDGLLLGRPVASAVGLSFWDFGHFIVNPERPRLRVPQPRQRAGFHDALFRAVASNGAARLLLVSAVPIFNDQDGSFEGFRGSASDVSDRLAAEADARAYRARLEATLIELRERNGDLSVALAAATAATKARSEFLAMISHELRTPLNAVIGFSELMKTEAYGPLGHENYAEFAGNILQGGQHLLAMINQVLDYVKLESGRPDLHLDEVSVREAVASSCRLIGAQARRRSITVEYRVPAELTVTADPRRLAQVLLNLLSNAVKFTPEGGRIELTAELDDMVAIHCQDSGIGIPADRLDEIFQPFRQVDSTLARMHEGTGLGLPIARSIAEQHGGSLTVSSEEGVGTRFTLRLPRASHSQIAEYST